MDGLSLHGGCAAMLVVTRRPGQRILIGSDIELFVVQVDGSQVRIGIDAPRSIRVLRRELVTHVEQENQRAAQTRHSTPQNLEALARALWPHPDQSHS